MENQDSLAFYPIRTLSALTGVNARTIRAWERRYELLTPFRTDSGHRLYTDEHVNTIRDVVRLLEQGVPISRVKPLIKPAALKIHAAEIRTNGHESEWPTFKQELLDATLKQDLAQIEKTCRDVLERYPFDVVLRYLLIPTRNELNTHHSAIHCSLFDFILVEKLLHKIMLNYPTEANCSVLVCSEVPREMSVDWLSFNWALVNQKIKPIPVMLPVEQLFELNQNAIAVRFYTRSSDMKAEFWQALKAYAQKSSAPLFVAGLFDREMLAFCRNLGLVPLSEDARKSAQLIADMLALDIKKNPY